MHSTDHDFYDDPEFDQEVVQALNEQTVTPFDRSVFRLGAVPGFAVKRKQQMPAGAPKYPKHFPAHTEGSQNVAKCSIEKTVTSNHEEPKQAVHLPQSVGDAGPAKVAAYHESHQHARSDDVAKGESQGQHGFSNPEDRALGDSCPADSTREDTCQVFVVEPGEGFFLVQTQATHTVAHLVAATNAEINENKYGGVTTVFGSPISPDTSVKHQGWYMLQAAEPNQSDSAQFCPAFPQPPVLMNKTRGRLLWDQKGWVADDEMEYYLYMIECYRPGSVFGILHLPDRLDQHTMLTEYVLRVANAASADPDGGLKAFVILHNGHWIPVIIRAQGIMIQLLTTPQSVHWIQLMLEAVIGNEAVQFSASVMPNAFEADCGFQAVGWILSTILDDTTSVPFSEEQAAQWRGLFYADLQYTGRKDNMITHQLTLGGMQVQRDQLQKLVTEHGVAAGRSQECAEQLIQALGLPAIKQILGSPKPWADLKPRASLQRPSIRIVLAEELKTLIQQKAQSPTPVGNKANKVKNKMPQKPPLQLKAEMLEVPHAVFKQNDGVELSQIGAAQIAPGCQGVAIVNIAEALPYFQLNEAVSQKGVALLVLEFDDPRLPQQHKVMKVPVQSRGTHDPLIVKVAVVQIGQQTVVRNTPAQTIAVPEVPNQVVRVLLFKDQYAGVWNDFVKSPVKCLMQQEPFRQLQPSDVIDVWDRQFMTTRMQRVQPEEADIFSVNLRINQKVQEEVFKANGCHGTYIEPRTQDGRHPDEAFQVVWLPKKSFSEAQVSQQTSKTPTTLVRQADRYGLRVASHEAEALHQLHRPDLVYIQGTELVKYRVGPMLFGSTKQSLVHVFSKWEWKARPVAPQGQAKDRSGVMWLVQAAEPPSHWIFQLSHGDVLISPEDKVIPVQQPPQAVVASSKTIQALQANAVTNSPEDPWIHHDPWARPSTREMPTSQVASLESRIEQSIIARMKQHDVDMPEHDTKVTELEARLDQLNQTVVANQQEAARQHQVVQTQLTALDNKVDQQQGFFQNTLESKLEQQMQRIEQLFSKRQRTNE